MKHIGAVTVARSDFSILLPVLRAIRADLQLDSELVVTGAHLTPGMGEASRDVDASGLKVVERINMLLDSDTPEGTAKSMGLGLIGFGQLFSRWRPDLLLIMGDRFEMFAAAAAALPHGILIGHIHGGETSEGAIDEAFRHAITKLAHFHFTATAAYRHRVIQLGEAPDRVFVTGAPALDNLRTLAPVPLDALSKELGIPLGKPPIVVTFHSTTLALDRTEADTTALLEALTCTGDRPVIFTGPNADPAGRRIRSMILDFVACRPQTAFVENLGTINYYGLLSHAAAMVGNSSSGIIEAASFGLAVVNIGNRQRGRLAGQNVIQATAEREAIEKAILRALDPAFRASLAGMDNPYGDGHAARRIVDAIKGIALSPDILQKRFYDLEAVE